MKRKIVSLLLVVAMALSVVAFTACSNPQKDEPKSYSRVTVDVNPSVEFMVDTENKVVAVTALNDDGSVLIAGEAFVGKAIEEATAMVVSLASETGYLLGGNAEEAANNVKISVSGVAANTAALYDAVEKKAKETLTSLDIKGSVAKAEAMTKEAAEKLCSEVSEFTEEQIKAMSESELYNKIAEARVETAELLTNEMREAYYSAKESKISFAESQATLSVINAMGKLYEIAYSGYKLALESYAKAISDLDEFRYERLVSPDSDYQKSLLKLREAKGELLRDKNYVARLEVNGEEYASASLTLKSSQDNYDKLLSAYEKLGSEMNENLLQLISILRGCESALRELENKFSKNIKDELKAKAKDIENAVNAAKDGFFEEFENEHLEDLENANAALLAQKNKLKEAVQKAVG